MTTITEEQKQDILMDVHDKFSEWMSCRIPIFFNGFDSINEDVFKPAQFDVNTLKNASSMQILDAILSCCEKLNFTDIKKWCALNAAACDADKIYNIRV